MSSNVPPAGPRKRQLVMTDEQLVALIEVRALAKSGEALRIRTGSGLSLADVAGAIGTAPATVNRWERGVRKPYGETALRYRALLATLRAHLSEPAGQR
jgi:DNA-binding transcriptional regulator YiaG